MEWCREKDMRVLLHLMEWMAMGWARFVVEVVVGRYFEYSRRGADR